MTTTPTTVIAASKSRRYEMALESQNASNPVGLTNTILRWSKEIMDETRSTEAVRKDPAIRLATYQLAFLCGVAESFDYSALCAECELFLLAAKAAEFPTAEEVEA